jgi:type II secretory pathway pseudopilin PulG
MMKHPTQPVTSSGGFTLLETIIYIGLFSLIFSGIFVSIFPIFTGAERLTKNIAIEGESAFVLAKIDYALAHTITSEDGGIISPLAGAPASNELVIGRDTDNNGSFDEEQFRFVEDNSNTFCTAPLVCKMLTLSENGAPALPLNATRVHMENFSVSHTAPTAGEPRYLDISFTAGGELIGPVRYYLHF